MKTSIKLPVWVYLLCAISTVYGQKEFKGSSVDYAARPI